ncbi:Hypothetical protein EAG7_04048 [Klebsiella aerogenes]|nr:Hypothetical protein EAG7_04048 [Klebsiella aerogenes]CCG32460.1 hypothetical protein [Klebsiella aerogenes EA1509E]
MNLGIFNFTTPVPDNCLQSFAFLLFWEGIRKSVMTPF